MGPVATYKIMDLYTKIDIILMFYYCWPFSTASGDCFYKLLCW